MIELDHNNCFSHFLLPFVFEHERFGEVLDGFDQQCWAPAKGDGQPFAVWQKHAIDLSDLLPHLAGYINPGDEESATLVALELSDRAQQELWGNQKQYNWYLKEIPRHESVPFKMGATVLFLFRTGVGFIGVRTSPRPTISVEQLVDFYHYFRFSGERRRGSLGCRRKVSKEQWAEDYPQRVGLLLDRPNLEAEEGGKVRLRELLEALLRNLDRSWAREIYERDRLLGFTSSYLSSSSMDDSAEEVAAVIHRLGNFYHSTHALQETDSFFSSSRVMKRAKDQYFTYCASGGSFIALDPADPFVTTSFPGLYQNAYLLLFLLVHHQRMVLINLADSVAHEFVPAQKIKEIDQSSDSTHNQIFERLRDRIFEFTSRGYFSQVTNNDQRQQYYTRWVETLAVEKLYSEIHDRVDEITHTLSTLRNTRVLKSMEEASRHQAASSESMRMLMREQMAATEALKFVEVGIAGVYLIKAVHILLDYSGQHHHMMEEGARFLNLPWIFWVILTIIFLTIPLVLVVSERKKKKILKELDELVQEEDNSKVK